MADGTTPDLAICGATVLTGDPRRSMIENGTILLAGGRILEIADGEPDERRLAGVRRIDARGRVATPGFVNVHTHAILTMVRGVAEDMGFAPAYTKGVPHGHDVRPEEAIALGRLGALEALLFGSTLVNDTFVHQDLTLPAMAETGIRAWGCGRIHDVDFSRVHLGEWEHRPEIGRETLDLAIELHESFHGAADGRMGVQLSPHAPDTCSRDLLEEIARTSERLNCRVNTHLSQSRVEVDRIHEREGLSPPEFLEELGLLNERLIAAHCIHVSSEDIARIGRNGVHVAHIAKGNQTHGHTAPTGKLRNAGARLTLGTDNMHADMVETMRWALATGRLQKAGVDKDWQPETVFEAATMGGARAMGLDDEIGSLEPGKKADVVLFDYRRPHLTPCLNPLGNLVHTAQGRDVDMVFVDGRLVVDGGRAVLVDQDAVIADAQKAAEALWQRAREQ
ncbi:amidohydrolase family protein [Fulvimarina sp. MAC8]|uniref:amidohydrolase family protein n=1 Tax=Fulvimarina sp. MAC8 TaxID=3162874 RepID=UPI0032EFFBB4